MVMDSRSSEADPFDVKIAVPTNILRAEKAMGDVMNERLQELEEEIMNCTELLDEKIKRMEQIQRDLGLKGSFDDLAAGERPRLRSGRHKSSDSGFMSLPLVEAVTQIGSGISEAIFGHLGSDSRSHVIQDVVIGGRTDSRARLLENTDLKSDAEGLTDPDTGVDPSKGNPNLMSLDDES
ncbi:unnamed protein product [Notodromas monacha]|uniref:Uncharacterized protein n=1 Tax=Notodromas monacha TaxID=399045 RepID=A0A7R9BHZ6_9CRUS|nr:unnamed protein product [Notodromas monacha]CAG0914449.1 unnamed protein product [Notodromas monacha]